jgi:YesN/AraC family two-component response regulator
MKKRILIVEDELFIAHHLKSIIEEDQEYEVFADIISVDQAILAIEKINPHLVLIDIKLKGYKDGIELGQHVLNMDNIPFIYITSYTDSITLERVKNTRPYGFIVKPFKKSDVMTTIYLTLNNYSHKNIDLLRTEKKILEDIPLTIRNVIVYIDENIYEKIEIEELAQLTRWKKHHFIRTFDREIGVTPYQYILKKKIDIAKSLIKETNQPINEIAFDLGFINYSNFSYTFKKFCNTTPENFRKAMSQKQNSLN